MNMNDDRVLDRFLPALRSTAASVARFLPAAGPLTVADPAVGADAVPISGPGARAVTADLGGALAGSLSVVVPAELAAALEQGPAGPQELADALQLALTDGAAALEPVAGGAVHAGPARETGGDAPDGGVFRAAVELREGGRHAATLVLSVDELPNLPGAGAGGGDAHHFEPLVAAGGSGPAPRSLDLLHDVEMAVTVELGRTRMTVRELLALTPGSVVELDRLAGSPVDVLVNNTLIARGEVVVIDEEFAVRVTEICGLNGNVPRAGR